jgi:hypothetical protein
MKSYDGLFKVPILEPPSYDGTRDTSGIFQEEVDQLIDELLVELKVTHHRLDPAARDAWVEAVIGGVGLPLQPRQMEIFG